MEKDILPEQSQPARFPPMVLLLYLLLLTFFCLAVGAILVLLFGQVFDLELKELLADLSLESSARERNFVRVSALVNQVFTFLLPALLLAVIFFRRRWLSFLSLDRIPSWKDLGMGFLFFLSIYPLAQFAVWVNTQIPLPEWAMTMETDTNEMIRNLLIADARYEVVFNLFLIGMIPALGEELFFRGIVQKQFSIFFKNPLAGLWIAAILFSAIHLQFQGFLARLLLGAALGYLFIWTRNLWVPIVAHFANNAVQVLAVSMSGREEIAKLDMQNPEPLPIWVTLLGLAATVAIGRYFYRRMKKKESGQLIL